MEKIVPMSRAAADVPSHFEPRKDGLTSPHTSQADVVPEHEMHAEHVAALETTLFRKWKATLVLSLESGRLRVLSRSADRRKGRES